MRAFTQVSPFDEATHFDYVLSLQSFEAPLLGEPYDDRVRTEWSCRGGYTDAIVLPPCDGNVYPHSQYPNAGVQRNPTGPVYYATSALLSAPIMAVFPDRPLTAVRIVGFVYLAATVLLLERAARNFGASAWNSRVLALVPMTMPVVLHVTSTVNSDAGLMVFGAACLLLASSARNFSSKSNLVMAIVLGLLAGFVKQTAILPVGALALYLLADTELNPKLSVRLKLATSAGAAALVGLGLWSVAIATRTPKDFESPIGFGNSKEVVGNPLDEIFYGALQLTPPAKPGFVPEVIRTAYQVPAGQLIAIAMLLATGAALGQGVCRRRSLAIAALGGAIASVVVVQVLLGLEGRYFPSANNRYALGVMPFFVALLATQPANTVSGRLLTAGLLGTLGVAALLPLV